MRLNTFVPPSVELHNVMYYAELRDLAYSIANANVRLAILSAVLYYIYFAKLLCRSHLNHSRLEEAMQYHRRVTIIDMIVSTFSREAVQACF